MTPRMVITVGVKTPANGPNLGLGTVTVCVFSIVKGEKGGGMTIFYLRRQVYGNNSSEPSQISSHRVKPLRRSMHRCSCHTIDHQKKVFFDSVPQSEIQPSPPIV